MSDAAHAGSDQQVHASVEAWLQSAGAGREGAGVLAIIADTHAPLADRLPAGATVMSPPESVDALPGGTRFGLGLIIGGLEALPATRTAEQLLARLRDLHCDRVEVLVEPGSRWSRSRMIALEYTLSARVQREAGEDWRVYAWDLAVYNPERDWNTPEHWANPQNFRRYRW